MKIAIIGTRGIPNNYGGFEQFAEYLSVGLTKCGHEVYVYSSHNHFYQKKKYNGVKIVHCYDPEYLVGTFGQFIYDLNCIIHTRNKNYDIILQLGYTSSAIWNFLIPKNSLLYTNMDGIEWKRSKFSKAVQFFLRYSENLAIKYSNYLISDSIGIKRYLSLIYKTSSKYIPYGAEINLKLNPKHLIEFNLKPYTYDILVARIEPENNIEMILEGYLNSQQKRRFVVVGSMNTSFGKKLFKKYKSNNILYLGFISDNSILNSLRGLSNLYFHGHSVGGTNPSLLEAMASNSLICAHRNIFNRSILLEDAFYFNSKDRITYLINSINRSKQTELIDSNLNKIKNLYTWPRIISSYNNFFNETN